MDQSQRQRAGAKPRRQAELTEYDALEEDAALERVRRLKSPGASAEEENVGFDLRVSG